MWAQAEIVLFLFLYLSMKKYSTIVWCVLQSAYRKKKTFKIEIDQIVDGNKLWEIEWRELKLRLLSFLMNTVSIKKSSLKRSKEQ